MTTADVGIRENVQGVGGPVRDGDDYVGCHHVVDERHVLVADSLDVVLPEAVVQQCRALEGFDCNRERSESLLQVIAGTDRAGRAGRRHECAYIRAPASRSRDARLSAPGPAPVASR